jgi:hypothetical protein
MAAMPKQTATTVDEYLAALPAALVRTLVKAQIARRARPTKQAASAASRGADRRRT